MLTTSHFTILSLGSGRFKVISPVDRNESMHDFEWRCYNVQELNDDPPQIPSSLKCSKPWKALDASIDYTESDVILGRKRELLNEISCRTNLSLPSLHFIWPAKLVRDIVNEIECDSSYEGVMSILPNVKDQYSGTFSFWLSSNLPLSNNEKLRILDGHCEAERLTLILRSIRKRTQHIRCKQCRSNIAQVSNVFTVGSADGTSGAYGKYIFDSAVSCRPLVSHTSSHFTVNEHGIVHQTTTLKSTIDGTAVCLGGAETRDR